MIGMILARRAVREAFTAINDRDLEAFMAGWRDDATFEYPRTIAPSGMYRGKPAV